MEAVVEKTTEEFESLGVGTSNEDTNSDADKERYEMEWNAFDVFDDGFIDKLDKI